MNIVKRILSDLDDSFLMPSQIDLMEFKFEGNLFELNFHSEFYDYFSDEFKQKLHNYKIKSVLNDGWYSFTIPVNKRKEFVSLVDKQWHKLRSE
ncbi:MAG: hypothetical protein MI865_12165 [Proteobacteria bacterium]|nr:hypothetical protein [Pseudomonadota bacterium]